MNKKILLIVMVMCFGSMMVMAENQTFNKGNLFIDPVVGVNSYAVPFGASFEYGFNEKVGVGGTFLYQSWSGITLITPSVHGIYHFNGKSTGKADFHVGLNLGFTIYSAGDSGLTGTSGLYLSPFAGIRYFLSPKMALSAKAYVSIVGDWSGVGTLLGVSFKVK